MVKDLVCYKLEMAFLKKLKKSILDTKSLKNCYIMLEYYIL